MRGLKRRLLQQRNISEISLIAHRSPKLSITEQYRQIRTNIMYSSVDKEIKTIMITSPEPFDGKTTTAANLAIVLAQQEKQVVLVDADLRKPSIHYTFKVGNKAGLTSVLTKRVSLNGSILNTDVPNLDILISGPIPPNPSELLDSKAMETVMNELEDRYDYVVIDTPPVMAVTDSQIMANKCDGVVLVVASGKTRKDRAMVAKELLEKTNAPLIGVVMNRVKFKSKYYGV